jgi:hypothetical protein
MQTAQHVQLEIVVQPAQMVLTEIQLSYVFAKMGSMMIQQLHVQVLMNIISLY